MKLLVVTCLIENKKDVMDIFHKASVNVFSMIQATGIKYNHGSDLLEDWFGSGEGEYDSLMLFSFTTEAAAGEALKQVNDFNREKETAFPIRAFVLSAEQSI
jgi:hypothetical protein